MHGNQVRFRPDGHDYLTDVNTGAKVYQWLCKDCGRITNSAEVRGIHGAAKGQEPEA